MLTKGFKILLGSLAIAGAVGILVVNQVNLSLSQDVLQKQIEAQPTGFVVVTKEVTPSPTATPSGYLKYHYYPTAKPKPTL